MSFLQEVRSNRVKAIKTLLSCLCMISWAISVTMISPAILHLTRMLNVSLQQITLMMPARAGGHVLGTILAAYSLSSIDHQPVIAVSMLLMSVTYATINWMPTLNTFMIAMFVNGNCSGFLLNALNVWMLHMWGKASVPFLHAISFAFSVGALLGPVLIAAFLQDISGASTDNNSTSTSSLDWTTTASTSDSPDSMLPTLPSIKIFESVASIATGPAAADAMQIMQLKAAIYVSASLCFIAFALFTLFCALYPQNQAHPTRSDESNDPEERSRTNGAIRTHRKVLIGLSCVYIHLAHGLEVAVAGLLPVFAVRCLLHLSTASGSMLLALYWNCFTVARALAVPISICFRPKQMMIANLIVVSVANLILFPFAEHHEWVLWFGTALLGFGIATMFPSLWAFLEELFPVSSKLTSLITLFACTGDIMVPFVFGLYADSFPRIYLYILAIYGSFNIFVFGACQLLATKIKDIKMKRINCDLS